MPNLKKYKLKQNNMNSVASLILPAIIGLLAGVGHGVTSHQQDLPFSLTEQVLQSMSGDSLGD